MELDKNSASPSGEQSAEPVTGSARRGPALDPFDIAFRAIPDATVLADGDRRIMHVNPAFTALFGYSLDDVRGRHTKIIYESEEAFEEQGRIRFNLTAEEKLLPYEVRYRRKTGEVFPGETVGTVVRDSEGVFLGYLGIIRDISLRKGLEKKLQDTLATLESRVAARTRELEASSRKLVAEIGERSRTEEALRKSEEKFRNLYLAMNEGVCLHDLVRDASGAVVNYRIVDVNPAYERILGIPATEAVGKLGSELYGTEEAPYLDTFSNVCRTGTPAYFETHFPPMDRHFSVSVFSPREGSFATVFSDISERRKSEKELNDAVKQLANEKARAESILAAMADGISIQDKEFRIIYQNSALLGMMGDQKGKRCFEVYEHNDGVCDGCPVAKTFADGRVHLSERRVTIGGEERFFEITASPVRDAEGAIVAGVEAVREITQRRKNEESIRRSEATLRSIMVAAPVGIGLVHNRVFSWVNDRMEEMTGYTRQELIGNSARMLYPSDEEFQRVGRIKYGQLEFSNVGSVNTVWRTKAGDLIDVDLRSSPLDPEDRSMGVTFTAQDISARKRAEAEKINMEKQVQHVQKLESLGILAGGIAHDFNNLLMAILGNADLALAQMSPAAPGRGNLIAIEQASRRAADLCQQMLAYSGKGKFVLESLDLSEVIREMHHMLQVSIPKSIVLKYNFAPSLPWVVADPTQMRQVMMNLIINGAEAIDSRSGVISVTTGAMECDRDYLRETFLNEDLEEGPYVFVEVADTGQGMDEETQAKIFDPFFTTKFTGRGLGMSAVLGIVRGHNGALKIYSELGKGTTIKVLFPAEKREGSDSACLAGAVEPKACWKGTGTVLLVDDEETVLTVAKQMLIFLGFSVLTASDGREALDIFKEHRDEITCVILDLTMPHVDGEEAFRELRRINPNVRVIMTSGYNEQEVTQKFVGKGLAGFIQKPYQLAPLSAKLEEVLGKGPGED